MEKEPADEIAASTHAKTAKRKIFRCSLCSFYSSDFLSTNEHISKHNEPPEKEEAGSEDTRFTCNRCSFVAYDEAELQAHKRFHKKLKDHYKCSYCEYSSANKTHVEEHENAIHTAVKAFRCRFCPFETRHQKSLVVHVRRHMGDKPYKCRYCNWKGYESGERTVHERTHTGSKPYACEICDFTTTSASGLNTHNKKHLHVKECECPYCEFKTATPIRLKKHILSQHSLKYCKECSFSTTCNREYREHCKIHTLTCLLCQKTFSNRPKLTEHQSVHTGIRKYGCELCDYNTNKKSLLTNHITKKHPS